SVRVIRQRGWSFDDEEHALGTRCVAAPIYNEHAEVLGAISLAGPSSRLPDERIKHLGSLVAHIAEDLTHRLGGRWAPVRWVAARGADRHRSRRPCDRGSRRAVGYRLARRATGARPR